MVMMGNDTFEERLTELDMFSLEKRRQWRHDCILQIPDGLSHRRGQRLVLNLSRRQD